MVVWVPRVMTQGYEYLNIMQSAVSRDNIQRDGLKEKNKCPPSVFEPTYFSCGLCTWYWFICIRCLIHFVNGNKFIFCFNNKYSTGDLDQWHLWLIAVTKYFPRKWNSDLNWTNQSSDPASLIFSCSSISALVAPLKPLRLQSLHDWPY